MSLVNWLKKNQVKPEEIEWLDISSLTRGKLKVTKEELLDYIRANKIEVQDVLKGIDEDAINTFLNDEVGENMTREEAIEFLSKDEGDNQPKYSDFQLRGEKSDYRELLLLLPNKSIRSFQDYDSFPDELKQYIDEKYDGNIDEMSEEEFRKLGYEIDYDMDGSIIGIYQLSEGAEIKDIFKSGHYDEANILAHVRFNTRISPTGERILFIEELQSDWHTAGREGGYKEEPYKRKYNQKESKKVIADIITQLKYIRESSGLSAFAPSMKDYETSDTYIRTGKYTKMVARIVLNQAYTDSRLSPELREKVFVLSSILGKLEDDSKGASIARKKNFSQVPNAPFKGNGWIELIMKRMLRYGADNNFDRIAWTTSTQQIDRWTSEIRTYVD